MKLQELFETDSNLVIQWVPASPSDKAYLKRIGLSGVSMQMASVEDHNGEEVDYAKVDGKRYRIDYDKNTFVAEECTVRLKSFEVHIVNGLGDAKTVVVKAATKKDAMKKAEKEGYQVVGASLKEGAFGMTKECPTPSLKDITAAAKIVYGKQPINSIELDKARKIIHQATKAGYVFKQSGDFTAPKVQK